MTPAARLQMAIEILEGLAQTSQPTDRFLKAWFRTRRFAGSGDRRAIAEQVFSVQRRRAHLAHRMGSDAPRALVIAALLEAGGDVEALFSGGYGPAPLTGAERAAIAATPAPAPAWVTGEYPAWLEPELLRAFGDHILEETSALIPRAPVDLRVNTLKATRDEVLAALEKDGITAAPTPYAPNGIRMREEAPNLARSLLFESGAFEFQDEAAQIASVLCDARPGMRVLDLAAGAGGKSLALAAAMQNRGEILACDVRGEALFELEKRAVRAGAAIVKTLPLDHGEPESAAFDLVLVDAPCSGSGTWRRQPELRWRLTPERLAELTQVQDRLLDRAAGMVKPGGRLVYATCSILPLENQDRAEAFRARRPDFFALNLRESWPETPPGLGPDFRASPRSTGTDGFYCTGFRRS
jgi:16S rRNA (cytosine967-C5)-methyltransferase